MQSYQVYSITRGWIRSLLNSSQQRQQSTTTTNQIFLKFDQYLPPPRPTKFLDRHMLPTDSWHHAVCHLSNQNSRTVLETDGRTADEKTVANLTCITSFCWLHVMDVETSSGLPPGVKSGIGSFVCPSLPISILPGVTADNLCLGKQRTANHHNTNLWCRIFSLSVLPLC
jgi:hypothetical protein